MGNNNMFLILLILIVPLGIFFFMRSRKKKKEQGQQVISGKRKKLESEAWVTVKKYLKDHNEVGKEIVELFVVKRPDPNDSSNLLTKELKQKHKIEKKKRKEQEKLEKKKDPKAYKEKKKKEKMKNRDEYWCLYFVTRNAKTKKIDEPRIIEAKITYIKINKKQTDRVIKASDNLNFKKEWEWIKTIKEKEDDAKLKNEKIQQKKIEKENIKKQKQKEKQKNKKA